jgi:hypothetical protein
LAGKVEKLCGKKAQRHWRKWEREGERKGALIFLPARPPPGGLPAAFCGAIFAHFSPQLLVLLPAVAHPLMKATAQAAAGFPFGVLVAPAALPLSRHFHIKLVKLFTQILITHFLAVLTMGAWQMAKRKAKSYKGKVTIPNWKKLPTQQHSINYLYA